MLRIEIRGGGIATDHFNFFLCEQMVTDHSKSTPIFWGHGKQDPLVRYAFGVGSAKFLTEEVGIPKAPEDGSSSTGLSFNGYDHVEHSTNEQELDDLHKWIKRIIPKTDD